jgi:hypothetical protein
LRRQNTRLELIPSDPDNTEALESYLMDLDVNEPDLEPVHPLPKRKREQEHLTTSDKRRKRPDLVVKVPYKRWLEQIEVQRLTDTNTPPSSKDFLRAKRFK